MRDGNEIGVYIIDSQMRLNMTCTLLLLLLFSLLTLLLNSLGQGERGTISILLQHVDKAVGSCHKQICKGPVMVQTLHFCKNILFGMINRKFRYAHQSKYHSPNFCEDSGPYFCFALVTLAMVTARIPSPSPSLTHSLETIPVSMVNNQ